MFEFHTIEPLNIEDEKRIRAALAKSNFRGCEYSLANNMAWYRLADTKITLYKDYYLSCSFKTESGFPEFTFPAGNGNLSEIIGEMKKFSQENNSPLIINSVPEERLSFFEENFNGKYKVSLDEGSMDYVYKRENLSELAGRKYHGKRNLISQFKKNYNWEYRELQEKDFEDIIYFGTNLYNKNEGYSEFSKVSEQFAINSFLNNYRRMNLSGGILFADKKIAAFTIGEPVNSDTYCIHIEKADTDFIGSYAMINNCFAKEIPEKFTYINREEDLGEENLRKAKRSYKPEFMIKKFRIEI